MMLMCDMESRYEIEYTKARDSTGEGVTYRSWLYCNIDRE